jgi:TetR/AcrR family fatty acid metabolism transcriptional regulator
MPGLHWETCLAKSSPQGTGPSLPASGRRPETRIGEIKAAARQELAEKGYEGFLPSEVARRCGVSEATVYRYFPTKRDLLVKVAEDWFEEVLTVEWDETKHTDVLSQLHHIIRYSLKVTRSQPALSRFVLLELRPDPAYRSMRIFELNRRFTSNVLSLVRKGIETGTFRPGISPRLVRDMIYGGIEHQTWSYLRGEGDFDIDETASGIASVVFHGLSATPLSGPAMLEPVVSRLEAETESLRDDVRALRLLLDRPAGGAVTTEKLSRNE